MEDKQPQKFIKMDFDYCSGYEFTSIVINLCDIMYSNLRV